MRDGNSSGYAGTRLADLNTMDLFHGSSPVFNCHTKNKYQGVGGLGGEDFSGNPERKTSTKTRSFSRTKTSTKTRSFSHSDPPPPAKPGKEPLRTRARDRFKLSAADRELARRVLEFFNKRARDAGIVRRSRVTPPHVRRIKRLCAEGATEREIRLVLLWGIQGDERWAESELMRRRISPETLLKSQSPAGCRVFWDYLECAEAWITERFGPEELERLLTEPTACSKGGSGER